MDNEIKEQLEEYRELEEGWNGYDAPPIPDSVVDAALNAADNLTEHEMEVFPTGCKSVQFEFETEEDGEVEFEILNEDEVYLYSENGYNSVYSIDEAINKV